MPHIKKSANGTYVVKDLLAFLDMIHEFYAIDTEYLATRLRESADRLLADVVRARRRVIDTSRVQSKTHFLVTSRPPTMASPPCSAAIGVQFSL